MALINSFCSYSQKKIIDTSDFGKWPEIVAAQISNDGKYVSYFVRNQNLSQLHIVSTINNWEFVLNEISYCEFLSDSKKTVFRTINDSLFILTLGTSEKKYIGQQAASFIYPLIKGKQDWLAFRAGDQKDLQLVNLRSGRKKIIRNVSQCILSPNHQSLVFWRKDKSNESGILLWLDLLSGEEKVVYTGDQIQMRYLSFDNNCESICFYGQKKNIITSVSYYAKGMDLAKEVSLWGLSKVDSRYEFDESERPGFNKDGNTLFFSIKRKIANDVITSDAARLNLWSYKDPVLQSKQLWLLSNSRTQIGCIDLSTNKVHLLPGENEALEDANIFRHLSSAKGKYVLVERFQPGDTEGSEDDFWWRESARSSVYLVSVKDGTYVPIKENVPYSHDWGYGLIFKMSPDERFVFYFDPIQSRYFTYEISTGISRDISSDAHTSFVNKTFENSIPLAKLPVAEVAGWLKDDKALWVYDNNDIWQLDPLGKEKPINLTNGYGRFHNIQFRLAMERERLPDGFDLSKNTKVLLSSFDLDKKDNGYYRLNTGSNKNPDSLVMDGHLYKMGGFYPLKAKNADVWLVKRESADEYPNYFVTSNFRHFRQITGLQPQKMYNWLTAELIRWKNLDGQDNIGILYKPENFDPKKKYPAIINYFLERSNGLHNFLYPERTKDEINIPWFVCRGYVVCVPDIHPPKVIDGESGYEAVNSVLSVANYLSSMTWVDSTKMGIQGHSHAGAETIELITHTKKFAAAVEGAGPSDRVSAYLQLNGEGSISSRLSMYEIGLGSSSPADGAGYSLWENKKSYLACSNILMADKVETPLLMMHNKKDEAVPWEQAIELYLSLRRLGKRVWWLQYDKGDHFVDGNDAIDYTIRMTQFFDHYLKGAPPPKWMTQGIPAKLKGIETGYELDTSGKEPEEQKVLYKGKIQLVRDAIVEKQSQN